MFDSQGYFVPSHDLTYFAYPPTKFYKLNLPDPQDVIDNISTIYSVDKQCLSKKLDEIVAKITSDPLLPNLINGPFVPFYLPYSSISDIGIRLTDEILPTLSEAFKATDPRAHFKAVIQDKQQLNHRILPAPASGYPALMDANSTSALFGVYFPIVFNQFSVSSQRKAFSKIKSDLQICLSGPLEICSSIVASPKLLIHRESYSPILNMSGAQHVDDRLTCCIKSYGPHLEFWVLTNNLMPGVEQVSEQWAGGLTVYTQLI